MNVFISPHSDDEALFGAFTLLREKPVVVIVMATEARRRAESQAAMRVLGAQVEFLDFRDDHSTETLVELLKTYGQPEMVFAPAEEENGNVHHNLIGRIARATFRNVTRYMTYTTAGKSTGIPVPFEPEWPLLKLKALACYESQVNLPSCQPHFMRSQLEYYQS